MRVPPSYHIRESRTMRLYSMKSKWYQYCIHPRPNLQTRPCFGKWSNKFVKPHSLSSDNSTLPPRSIKLIKILLLTTLLPFMISRSSQLQEFREKITLGEGEGTRLGIPDDRQGLPMCAMQTCCKLGRGRKIPILCHFIIKF